MSGSSLQAKEDQYLGEESCSRLHPLLLITWNIFTTFHPSQTRWCPSSNHFGELLDPGCFPKSTRPVCGGKISIYEMSTKSFFSWGMSSRPFPQCLIADGQQNTALGKWKWKWKWRGGTLGQNRSFWLLKRFLIFQGIRGDLDVNVSKHTTMTFLLQIIRYFKFVLWVI